MSSVTLMLPPEVIEELRLPHDGVRDADGIVMAVEGLNVAASLATLAMLLPQARQLAQALRRWRLRQPRDEVLTLTVTGKSIAMRIDLPPNVHVDHLLDQLRPLLDEQ